MTEQTKYNHLKEQIDVLKDVISEMENERKTCNSLTRRALLKAKIHNRLNVIEHLISKMKQ